MQASIYLEWKIPITESRDNRHKEEHQKNGEGFKVEDAGKVISERVVFLFFLSTPNSAHGLPLALCSRDTPG